jgi:hypothetical protein
VVQNSIIALLNSVNPAINSVVQAYCEFNCMETVPCSTAAAVVVSILLVWMNLSAWYGVTTHCCSVGKGQNPSTAWSF